ncbi:MAG: class I adenylate-forming enzyme family protein, partial [Pseudomonadota bacterium]
MDDLFRRNVAETPERLALVDDPRKGDFTDSPPERLTYAALADRVDRLAAVFDGGGLRADDLLLVQLPNVAELIAVYLAAARLGLVVTPIPVQYREKEIGDVLDIAKPKAAVTALTVRGVDHAAMIRRSAGEREISIYALGTEVPGPFIDLSASIAKAAPLSHRPGPAGPNDIFTVCWTSGTEARAKAVPRTHNNWVATGYGIIDGAGMAPNECLLNPFPAVNIASIGGLVVPWLMTGGTLVLHIPFDLETFVRQLSDEKVTYTVAAPAILNRLIKDPSQLAEADLSALRSIGTGGAPPDAWMMAEFQKRHGIAVTNFFGSNEGMSFCASGDDVPDPDHRSRLFPRAGRPEYEWRNRGSNWSRTKLTDPETGEEITQAGVPGEMAISGPTVFPGYFRTDENRTVDFDLSPFDKDGYFRSGDLFEIAEEDGDPRYYRFVGRKKEIIIRGGMNISPAEVETVLGDHPALVEAAAAGIADREMGERVGAFVVPQPGETVTLDMLTAYLTDRGLARYKLPERLFVMEELPRSPLNKVLRRE